MSPSSTASFTPVTVMVWGVFQLLDLNVSGVGDTVPSVRSELDKLIVTFAVGWLVSTTLNVAVPPASVVVNPEMGVTRIGGARLISTAIPAVLPSTSLMSTVVLPAARHSERRLKLVCPISGNAVYPAPGVSVGGA